MVRQRSVIKQKAQHIVHAVITSKLQKYTSNPGEGRLTAAALYECQSQCYNNTMRLPWQATFFSML